MIFSKSTSANTVKFCYEEQELRPYLNGYQVMPPDEPGILLELIKQASKQAELNSRFIRRPWLRCQKMVLLGQAHSLFAMIKTPDRQLRYQFPNNPNNYLLRGDYVIFFHNKSHKQNYIENVAEQISRNEFNLHRPKFGFGAPRGYVITKRLEQLNLLANNAYDLTKAIKLMSNNRLDGFIIDRYIGLSILEKSPAALNIQNSKTVAYSDAWHVPFNKQYYARHKTQIDRFWSLLPALRKKYEAELANRYTK